MAENEKVEELLRLLSELECEMEAKKHTVGAYNDSIKSLKTAIKAKRLEIQNG